MACNPKCNGNCYSVGVIDGTERFIHPPKPSVEWLAWVKRCEAPMKVKK